MQRKSQQQESITVDGEIADPVRSVIIPELDSFDAEEANAILLEAERGNAVAQYIIGVAFEGLLPPRSNDARNWYKLAAEQGYIPAQKKLCALKLQ